MKFNEKLIKLRKQEGMSQEELGERLGVTRQTVSKWELGTTTPEMSKLKELAELFKVSADELLSEEETKEEKVQEENPIQQPQKESDHQALKIVLIVVLGLILVGMLIKIIIFNNVFGIFKDTFNAQDQIVGQFFDLVKNVANQSQEVNKEDASYEDKVKNMMQITENIIQGDSADTDVYNSMKETYDSEVKKMEAEQEEAYQKALKEQQKYMEQAKKEQQKAAEQGLKNSQALIKKMTK